MSDRQCSSCGGFCGRGGCKRENMKPPAHKPLTDEQILELLPDVQHGWTTATYGKWVARAIERAHGIGEA